MTDHLDSPNLGGLDRWAFETRRVEKPWGYELIWAVAEAYVGKILFVKAGESLSLQFHREKDESWYVQSGRARLELGARGGPPRVIARRRSATARHVHRVTRSRTRRSSRSRRRTSTTSSASRTTARAPSNPDTLVVRSPWS